MVDWTDGQARRAWLNQQDARLRSGLNYYLGPAARPVEGLAQVMSWLSPGADMMDAGTASQDLMASKSPWEAAKHAGGLGAAMLGMALPGTARGASDGVSEGYRMVMGLPSGLPDRPARPTATATPNPRADRWRDMRDRALADGDAIGARNWQELLDTHGGGAAVARADVAVPPPSAAPASPPAAAQPGIRAYHGSPSDHDRFSLDHIGTGEGAQAQGRGLYFAGAEDVGTAYRNALSPETFTAPDGRTFGDYPTFRDQYLAPLARSEQGDSDFMGALQRGMQAGSANGRGRGVPIQDELRRSAETLRGVSRNWDPAHPSAREFQGAADFADRVAGSGVSSRSNGHMYEVNIAADPASMIDYDNPLSGQSQAVRDQAAARGIGLDQPGRSLVDALDAAGDRGYPAAMAQAGIPGVRYMDQGSRGTAGGTSNYVVFDDNLVSIMRKYGLLGAVGAGGIAGAMMAPQESQRY